MKLDRNDFITAGIVGIFISFVISMIVFILGGRWAGTIVFDVLEVISIIWLFYWGCVRED
jgi:hypothetical protein